MQDLNKVEQEITLLLARNESNWEAIAQLALKVQNDELYKQRGIESFTAWVRDIAQRCDRTPALIWRYIKAARYYMQQVGSDSPEQVREVKAAPEALERLEKIERTAPPQVFEKLKEKVLDGLATVAECRRIEQDYRPFEVRSNRGRPKKGEEGTYQHLGKWKDEEAITVDVPVQPIQPESLKRSQIAPTIVRSLDANLVDWVSDCAGMRYPPRHYKTHQEVRINIGQRRRIDFLAVVRWSLKRPKDLIAVEIKSCVGDYESDNKWTEYLDFCHYFCFACPYSDEELLSLLSNSVPSNVGILGIDFGAELQSNLTYPVKLIQNPDRLPAPQVSEVYETLYERMLDGQSIRKTISQVN